MAFDRLNFFHLGAKCLLVTLLAFISTPSIVLAQTVQSELMTPQKIYDVINKILPKGQDLGCVVQDFAQLVQPGAYASVGLTQDSNMGLKRHYQNLVDNDPTFGKQLKNFYGDIAKLDKLQGQIPEPKILDVAGDAQHAQVRPGEIWTLALKHSAGSSSRAMQLIGACGHDRTRTDISIFNDQATQQKNFTEVASALDNAIVSNSNALKNAKASKGNKTGSECQPVENYSIRYLEIEGTDNTMKLLQLTDSCSDFTQLARRIAALKKFRRELTPSVFKDSRFLCPEDSVLHLNQSLGKGIDIPDALKKRIIGTSDLACDPTLHTNPSNCIAAKYYHVIGSAAIACELIAMGHDPGKVILISEAAGFAYRSFWLSDMITKAIDSGKSDKTAPSSRASAANRVAAFLTNKGEPSCTASNAPEAIDIMRDHPNIVDAITLLKRWTVTDAQIKKLGKLGEQFGTISTNWLLPEGMLGVHDFTYELVKPHDWSEERYKKARAEVKSILSDFAWTMAQHRVGAEFGAKVCRKDPSIPPSSCLKQINLMNANK